ncbi:hypothetical protein S96127_4307 (plasmid) [Yersinia pestis]|nr:hypothetical protein S96127_4307 [Yersinia pestis]
MMQTLTGARAQLQNLPLPLFADRVGQAGYSGFSQQRG